MANELDAKAPSPTVDIAWGTLATLSAATIHEAAGRIGALPPAIRPIDPSMRMCGTAVTVNCEPGNNLSIHHAVYTATRGDVLVIAVGDGHEYGYWGEILTFAAQVRGLRGVVLDGGVRDTQRLIALGLPVFARCTSIRGTGKQASASDCINVPVKIGDVTVVPGDVIVGDADGVVAISPHHVERTIARAVARDQQESDYVQALKVGRTTLELLGLD